MTLENRLSVLTFLSEYVSGVPNGESKRTLQADASVPTRRLAKRRRRIFRRGSTHSLGLVPIRLLTSTIEESRSGIVGTNKLQNTSREPSLYRSRWGGLQDTLRRLLPQQIYWQSSITNSSVRGSQGRSGPRGDTTEVVDLPIDYSNEAGQPRGHSLSFMLSRDQV